MKKKHAPNKYFELSVILKIQLHSQLDEGVREFEFSGKQIYRSFDDTNILC